MVERPNVNGLFLTEDESYEAGAINTDLKLYMESAIAKFIVGEWTVEANWDEYIKGLESLGAFDLVDIYQTAYDRQN
jgi:putative aldouronate transport system substrate-binding protein